MNMKKSVKYIAFGAALVGIGYTANMIHYTKNYVLIERTNAENVERYNTKRVKDGKDILLQDKYVLIDKTEIGHFSTLFEAYNEIKDGYIEEMDTKTLVDGAISGMVSATGDRHTAYTPKKEGEKPVDNALSKSYKGIGAELTALDGYIVITNPYKGSPAFNAGIRPYDRILEVDEEEVTGMNLDDVVNLIKGEKGTKVTLKLERNVSEIFDATVVREEIKTESVLHKIVQRGSEKVGILEIMAFGEVTAKDFKHALDELEKDGITHLVIDVRDNGGGYLGAVQKIASEFLPLGETTLTLEDRNGKRDDSKSTNLSTNKKPYPIAVLVNENSASSSEVLTAALKERGEYPVVGTKTFGKGTVQELVSLGDKSEIRMTVAKWLTPDGNWVHEKGIAPTVEVKQSEVKRVSSIRYEGEPELIGEVSVGVRNAQVVLNTLGYKLDQRKGYFDEETQRVLLQYQKATGIEETGVLDEATVKTLNSELLHLKADSQYDDQLNTAIEVVLEK